MTGEDVRQVFEAILPDREIEHLCRQCGVIERQRKLHLGMLVRAMVIAAGTPGGAYHVYGNQKREIGHFSYFVTPRDADSSCNRVRGPHGQSPACIVQSG
jgi:hypothetical protein